MSWSIKLFKIKGIDVKVHLTFFLILIWAAYRWSGSTGAGLQGALFGVVATLLLFAAVTLHELGHSFQALKYGVHVKDITLMPLGGLAQMEEMPKKPLQELRIAIAGPLVNFAIAALLVGLGALLQTQSVVSLGELTQSLGKASWTGMLAYLTMANLALGLFNLVPAFPMDGGRVLRALLAMRLDYTKATRIAALVGQGLAMLIGLWGFMNGSYTLVLIAIFVWMGAGQESKDVQVKDVLGEIRVGQAMTRSPHTLNVNDSLSKAVELTLSTSQSAFPVLEWGTNKVVGMLCEPGLIKGLQGGRAASPVREFMKTTFQTVTTDEPLSQALQRMATGKVHALPVLDRQGQLVGLLTADDVNEAYRLLSASPDLAYSA
ncbi:MAG: site-2 protease family protein [Anaerolineales bacterium]|nr:site-2 protease family protein [Anaerolineales bacterium]